MFQLSEAACAIMQALFSHRCLPSSLSRLRQKCAWCWSCKASSAFVECQSDKHSLPLVILSMQLADTSRINGLLSHQQS